MIVTYGLSDEELTDWCSLWSVAAWHEKNPELEEKEEEESGEYPGEAVDEDERRWLEAKLEAEAEKWPEEPSYPQEDDYWDSYLGVNAAQQGAEGE